MWAVAFSHDEQWLVSGSRDKTLCLYDLQSLEVKCMIPFKSAVTAVAFADKLRNGCYLVCVGCEDGSLFLIELKEGEWGPRVSF